LGATVVVVGQVLTVLLFLQLLPTGQSDEGLAPIAWVPLLAYTGALLWLASGLSRRVSTVAYSKFGMILIAVAPFTAFGGGCGTAEALSTGVGLFRSGVRLGVDAGSCVAYLNGVLVVLGYGLLTAGLWVQIGQRE
jgi:hypothetical protein